MEGSPISTSVQTSQKVDYNGIGDRGIEAIARNQHKFNQLLVLGLSNIPTNIVRTGISQTGIQILENIKWTRLSILHLSTNALTKTTTN